MKRITGAIATVVLSDRLVQETGRLIDADYTFGHLQIQFFSEFTQFALQGTNLSMYHSDTRKEFVKFYIAYKFNLDKLLMSLLSLEREDRLISSNEINLLLFNGASYDNLTGHQQVKACESLLAPLTLGDDKMIIINKLMKELTFQQIIALGKEIIQFHNVAHSGDVKDLELVKVMLQQTYTQYHDYDISFYRVIFDKLVIKQDPQLLQLVHNNLKLATEKEDYQLIKKILRSIKDEELTQALYTTVLDTAIIEGNTSLLQIIKDLNPKVLANLLNGTNVITEQLEEGSSFLIHAIINSDKSDKHLKFLEELLSIKGIDVNKGIAGDNDHIITLLLYQCKTQAFDLLMKHQNIVATPKEVLDAIIQIADENIQWSMWELFVDVYKPEQLLPALGYTAIAATNVQVEINSLGDHLNNNESFSPYA